MDITQQILKELFLKSQNFHAVQIPRTQRGAYTNVNIGYGSIRAQALADIDAGNAVAFQTDQGNWYLAGSSTEQPVGQGKRQISYRVVRGKKPRTSNPVKSLFPLFDNNTSTLTLYVGGDAEARPVEPGISYQFPVFDVFNYIVNLGEGDEYIISSRYTKGGDTFFVNIDSTGNLTTISIPNPTNLAYFFLGNGNWINKVVGIPTSSATGSEFISATPVTYTQVTKEDILSSQVEYMLTANTQPVSDDLYTTTEWVTVGDNARFLFSPGVKLGFGNFTEPGVMGSRIERAMPVYRFNGGSVCLQVDDEVSIDLNYVFIKLGENIEFRHICQYTRTSKVLDTRRSAISILPYPGGAFIEDNVAYETAQVDLRFNFTSWIKQQDSIELKVGEEIKTLNTDRYFLFRFNSDNLSSDLKEISVTIDDTFRDINFIPGLDPVTSVEGFEWSWLVAPRLLGEVDFSDVVNLLQDRANYPFGQILDRVTLNYQDFENRELYKPEKYIGERMLCFFDAIVDGESKSFVGRGTLTSAIAERVAYLNVQTKLRVSLDEIIEVPQKPYYVRNVATLDNGSFYSFALAHSRPLFSAFITGLNVLCPEILKVCTFSKNLPSIESSWKYNPNWLDAGLTTRVPVPIGNEHLQTDGTRYYSEFIQERLAAELLSVMNIIDNRIYIVLPHDNSEVINIAEWIITEDGRVKFEQVLEADYTPVTGLPIYSSSYYPD